MHAKQGRPYHLPHDNRDRKQLQSSLNSMWLYITQLLDAHLGVRHVSGGLTQGGFKGLAEMLLSGMSAAASADTRTAPTVELAARGGAGAVAVTTSSPERGARLRELGATHVLDRAGVGEPSAPALYDIIIDIAAGPETSKFIGRLAANGRLVIVGIVAGPPPSDFGMRLMDAFQLSRSVSTFSLDTVPTKDRNSVRAEHFDAAVRGDLHAFAHNVIPLAHAADAHRDMDRGNVFGRIVLTPT